MWFRNFLLSIGITLIGVAASAQTLQTPQGHVFTYHHMPDAPRVAIAMAWKGGIGHLAKGKENIMTFGPWLVTDGGSQDRSAADIRAEFEAMDSGAQLYTAPDAVRGFIVAPAQDLKRAVEIANEVLARPALEDRWLQRFIRTRKAERAETEQQLWAQAWYAMRRLTMGDHPLRQAWSFEPLDNLDTLTGEDAQRWYDTSLGIDDLIIAATGPADVDIVANAIDIALSGLPTAHTRTATPPLDMAFSGKTILIHRPTAQKSYVLVTGKLPGVTTPGDTGRELAVGVLGYGDQSRLFTAIRKELRGAYGFSARKHGFTRAQDVLALQGEIDTKLLGEGLAAIEDTYTEFRTGGIGRLEFPFAKRFMVAEIKKNTAKPENQAYLMIEAALNGRNIGEGLDLLARAQKLTRRDTNAQIKAEFPPYSKMLKIVVSPDRQAVVADCIITHFSEVGQCR
ncbi:MAG: M16 family metallopeptidase [Paracoccaceae bacterium]